MLEFTYSALRQFSVGSDNIIIYPDKVTITAPKMVYMFRLPSPPVHIFDVTVAGVPTVIIISQSHEGTMANHTRQDSIISQFENSWRHQIVSNFLAFTSKRYYYVEDDRLFSSQSKIPINVLWVGSICVCFETRNMKIIGTTILFDDDKTHTLSKQETLDYVFLQDDFIYFRIRRKLKPSYYLIFDSTMGQPYANCFLPFIQLTSLAIREKSVARVECGEFLCLTNYTLFNPQTSTFYETLISDGKHLSINQGDEISWCQDKFLYIEYKTNKYRIFSELDFEFVNHLTSYYKDKLIYQLWLLKQTPLDCAPPKLVWLYKIYPYT